MFNTIVISCIFFSLLGVCKIAFQLEELIRWKNDSVKKSQDEANKFNLLLNLSKSEISVIKYLLTRPALSAWLPNETITILLTHKGYIEIVCNKRKKFDIFDNMNLYKNENDTLYTISQQTKDLINNHREELNQNQKWRKIKINRRLDNYQ